jgi:hypothetical protein
MQCADIRFVRSAAGTVIASSSEGSGSSPSCGRRGVSHAVSDLSEFVSDVDWIERLHGGSKADWPARAYKARHSTDGIKERRAGGDAMPARQRISVCQSSCGPLGGRPARHPTDAPTTHGIPDKNGSVMKPRRFGGIWFVTPAPPSTGWAGGSTGPSRARTAAGLSVWSATWKASRLQATSNKTEAVTMPAANFRQRVAIDTLFICPTTLP